MKLPTKYSISYHVNLFKCVQTNDMLDRNIYIAILETT